MTANNNNNATTADDIIRSVEPMSGRVATLLITVAGAALAALGVKTIIDTNARTDAALREAGFDPAEVFGA